MLNMKLINRGTEGELQLIGSLDALSAQNAEKLLLDTAARFDILILDMARLDYISSAGLSVLKQGYLAMRRKGGELMVRNVNEAVMEIFEITGFVGMLKFL